ncbi:unnamed protein product [Microthlaspi erraticum]|uniref:F-box domain-containing protein n=1 Tax=Microthlaspi erraticum TaxID=1685480 RepID=A0A6D2KDQ7_9BRAS|nr:unnamed protein product [Microthlaspi erraticum]
MELEEESPQNKIAIAPTTASAAMNSDVEPPQNKETTFSSLPEEIVVSFLARISKTHYPKLSLVSKSFCSLISSFELDFPRCHLKKLENFFYVCLQLPDRSLPSWFSLWIKPDQTLTNDILDKDNNKSSSGNTLLVRVPSSYSPLEPPTWKGTVGSKTYLLGQCEEDSSSPLLTLWVCNEGVDYDTWCDAPSMAVARENAVAGFLDGKIYVMGGCKSEETANWAEVFDTKTETWEALPDPGAELRFSLLKTMRMIEGKVYVERGKNKYYVYDPKEGRWEGSAKAPVDERRMCAIDVCWYHYDSHRKCCVWYDEKRKEWRVVKGLEAFDKNCRGGGVRVITLANYGGKLLTLWDEFEQTGGRCRNKNIWCSVINLERRNGDDDDDDEVWGTIE